jgi:hypothetical protein
MKTLSGKLKGTPTIKAGKDGENTISLKAQGARGGETKISLEASASQIDKLRTRLGKDVKGPAKVGKDVAATTMAASAIAALGKGKDISPALRKTLAKVTKDPSDRDSITKAIGQVTRALEKGGMDLSALFGR